MNNASLVIWRSSNLGLRSFAQSESVLSIYSKLQLLKGTRSTECPPAKRHLHSASPWAAHRANSPGWGTSLNLCVPKHTGMAWCSSISKTTTNLTPTAAHSASASVRFQSTQAKPQKKSAKDKLEDPFNQFIPLSRNRHTELFGPGVTVQTGNNVLETLHGQRIRGTLDEGITAPGVDEVLVAKALAYLREAYPYDEDAAITRRIEDEDRQAEEKYTKDAERLGIYKPQQNADPENLYGKSGLDAIKEHYENKAIRRESEDPQPLAPDSASPDSALVEQPKGRAVLARRTESAEWVKRYKEKAQLDGLKSDTLSPTQKARRILPSAIFCLAVVWFCVLLAQNYVPPPKPARLWPDIPPAAATVITVIALNFAGLVLWRLPPMWRFMNTFFLIIPARPRIWSMLGNVFSHQSPAHFFGNMLVLWFVGTRCKTNHLPFASR